MKLPTIFKKKNTRIHLVAAGRQGRCAYLNYEPQRIALCVDVLEPKVLTNRDEIVFPQCGHDTAIIVGAYIADKYHNVLWRLDLSRHVVVDSIRAPMFAPGALKIILN